MSCRDLAIERRQHDRLYGVSSIFEVQLIVDRRFVHIIRRYGARDKSEPDKFRHPLSFRNERVIFCVRHVHADFGLQLGPVYRVNFGIKIVRHETAANSASAIAIGPPTECRITSMLTPCWSKRLARMAAVSALSCSGVPALSEFKKISANRPSGKRPAVAR